MPLVSVTLYSPETLLANGIMVISEMCYFSDTVPDQLLEAMQDIYPDADPKLPSRHRSPTMV